VKSGERARPKGIHGARLAEPKVKYGPREVSKCPRVITALMYQARYQALREMEASWRQYLDHRRVTSEAPAEIITQFEE
jgi:hypothetical protein